jgi:hypothetical protein
MGDRPCEIHLDHRGEHPVVTLSFAGDVALALALAKHSVDDATARDQFTITSEGAVAFASWADTWSSPTSKRQAATSVAPW